MLFNVGLLISRESDVRAVCGLEEFDPPPTHKGPQMNAFIVKVSLNESLSQLRSLLRLGGEV